MLLNMIFKANKNREQAGAELGQALLHWIYIQIIQLTVFSAH